MNTDTNYADLFFSNISNDKDTLEKNVKEYPFSSVARFLLLCNYKKNGDPAFDSFVKQTGLYINNPFWFQYQLSKINNDSFVKENQTTGENIPLATEEFHLSANEPIAPIPVSDSEAITEIKNDSFVTQNQNIEENIPAVTEDSNPSANEQTAPIPVSDSEAIGEIKNDSFVTQNQNIEENIPAATEDSNPSADEQTAPIPVSDSEAISEIKNDSFVTQNQNIEENISAATEESLLSANEQIAPIPVSENEAISQTENDSFVTENQNIEENIPSATEESLHSAKEQIAPIPVFENEIKEEKSSESEAKNIDENEEDPIPFEPLHTVDYFASQGIKISEEALENDHLGKQVKSFTAWLKSMKKLHPGQLPEQNAVIEKIIQANAEVSNQNANVLTEAMAEVLVKQNKQDKAIEMYQKLSLINPSKSAYFAAKIESLKII